MSKLLVAIAIIVTVLFAFFPTPMHAENGEFSWYSMYTNYEQSFWDVWGTSPNDIFAVGDNVILHYNGTNWISMVNNSDYNLRAIWGSSSSKDAFFHTYLYTGTRRSELLSVRWSDIDLWGMTMSINRSMQFIDSKITFKPPKTASSRRLIALSPDSCLVLREHRKTQDDIRQRTGLKPTTDSDLVFCHYNGAPLLPDSITHAWLKLVRRCGLSVSDSMTLDTVMPRYC